MIRDDGEGTTTRRRAEKLGHSRVGALWAGMILAAVVLVLLLIFVSQNNQSVTMRFLWLTGQLPLGVAILLAVIVGVLAGAIPGSIRIMQLRRLATGRSSNRARRPDRGPDSGDLRP